LGTMSYELARVSVKKRGEGEARGRSALRGS
jgi:hypothetical protein